MPGEKNSWLRPLLILILVLAGVAITLLPHWLRSGRTVGQPVILEGLGSYSAPLPPDSLFIVNRLRQVIDPELGADIIHIGLLEKLHLDSAGNVEAVFSLTTPFCPFVKNLAQTTLDTLITTPGVRHVRVKFDPSLRSR